MTQRNWVLYRIHDTCAYLEKAALLASDTGTQQKGEVLPVQRHLDVEVERLWVGKVGRGGVAQRAVCRSRPLVSCCRLETHPVFDRVDRKIDGLGTGCRAGVLNSELFASVLLA